MEYQQIIAIAISLVFLTFATAMAIREGEILTSVSASTYRLEGMNKLWFYGTLLLMGALNLFMGMAVWGLFASFCIMLAGMTMDHAKGPTFQDEAHTFATVLAILLTYLGMGIMYGVWFPFVVLGVFSLLAYLAKLKNMIWWIEIVAMITTSVGYYVIHHGGT